MEKSFRKYGHKKTFPIHNIKKGPVFATAVIAGTMGAKKTSDLIPFCHHIPLEGCKITIEMDKTEVCIQ
jgi:cyclic pyranopterin phosphate synthase